MKPDVDPERGVVVLKKGCPVESCAVAGWLLPNIRELRVASGKWGIDGLESL